MNWKYVSCKISLSLIYITGRDEDGKAKARAGWQVSV
jgi:hypothetical protein